MNQNALCNIASTIIVAATVALSGCAAQPSVQLALNGQPDVSTIVDPLNPGDGQEQRLVSTRDESIVVVSPQQRAQLSPNDDLWINIVAVNASHQPVTFSPANVTAAIGGEYVAVPSAEEMEKQRKNEVLKGQLFGFATMIAGAAAIDSVGGSYDQYVMDSTMLLVDASEIEGEITEKLVAKYEDVVLKEATIGPRENHGGMIRIRPPADDTWHLYPLIVSVDVAGERHRFEFDVAAHYPAP